MGREAEMEAMGAADLGERAPALEGTRAVNAAEQAIFPKGRERTRSSSLSL